MLTYLCERCGKSVVLHRGDLTNLPNGMKLLETIALVSDDHKCPEWVNYKYTIPEYSPDAKIHIPGKGTT